MNNEIRRDGRNLSISIMLACAALALGSGAHAALIHQWTFNNGDITDIIGNADITAGPGVTVADNQLVLDGGEYAFTSAISQSITNRTLISWVGLTTLSQGGGSALSIQSSGSAFDGIVYGERKALQWMNGSDYYNRTPLADNGGPGETVLAADPPPNQVMMAITYSGTSIQIYRDGQAYGSATPTYTVGGQQTYLSGDGTFRFGQRVSGSGSLASKIDEAQVYDTALSQLEIQAIFAAGPVLPAPPPPQVLPLPLHRWSFNDGTAQDVIGNADGTLFNGASISNGQLRLDGINDYVRTVPIDASITTKTLVAWLTLDNVTQRSGGALTLEDPSGDDIFDSLVFGERTAGQWMNGSNGWSRSGPGNNFGLIETTPAEVMIAIAYGADGTISIFRNGEPYAAYITGAPIDYVAGLADVLLGLRHEYRLSSEGSATGNDAFWAGLINEARIYGVDLTAANIAALSGLGPNGLLIPEPASLALLSTGALLIGRRRRA